MLVNDYHTSKKSNCCGKEVKYDAATCKAFVTVAVKNHTNTQLWRNVAK